ncbi:MAG: TonB-dependent receptor [Rikenellaceae bacterium]
MKKLIYVSLLLLVQLSFVTTASARTFSVRGRVVNSASRQAIAFAAVTVEGQPQKGTITDIDGNFVLEGVTPGLFRFVAQSLGFDSGVSADVQVSAMTAPITIEMAPNSRSIDTIVVRPYLFRKVLESPVSMKKIGIQQIEKSAGANRDVSRIVQSYPGVSFIPGGSRNDLIVRGGSPSENKFYIDDIEIPNINHFSTQGASGGPVSILNADLIREIDFYTGAFPVERTGALSSMMDVKLRDGDMDRQSFKATVGASEISLSGSGHFNDKTNYLFSIRQSYLQLLFKMIGLPFLPNFIDGQAKVERKLSDNDEIMGLVLFGIDDLAFNEQGTIETTDYILGYLPRVEQQTVTTGVRYKRFTEFNSFTLVASHSLVNNLNIKYIDNDESSEDNLKLRLQTTEQKTTLRNENRSRINSRLTLRYGGELNYSQYSADSFSLLSTESMLASTYESYLGLVSFGLHGGAGYISRNERFTFSAGMRFDANNFSKETLKLWEQFSPRVSLSYSLPGEVSISANTGIYYAMPPYTALSYKEDGVAVNANLDYTRVTHYTVGADWRPTKELFLSMEAFYKDYSDMAVLTVTDANGTFYIPLSDQGTDWGSVGDDAMLQSGDGRAYGLELMGQWNIPGKLSLVSSFTMFRSEYKTTDDIGYRSSAWDNRFIFNANATYFMKKGWSIGGKVSAIGGSPYTPYDEDITGGIGYWDLVGRPYSNYTLYNSGRLPAYAQLDLRVDKMFYFSKWMLGLYLDVQNVFMSSYVQQELLVSTGEIDPDNTSRYKLEWLNNSVSTLLPTFGITAQF